jgi:hypothetical protein
MHTQRLLRLPLLAALLVQLSGCASAPPAGHADWHELLLPGKAATRYAWDEKEGRSCVSAVSEKSASMWRKRVAKPAADLGQVSFSWWVQDLVPNASVADIDKEDAPARVIFGFDGDTGKLSAKNRALFELAHALTGEPPPYATLMYVWDSNLPVGTVVINPRSDRVRKIVVDSGPAHLRRWRDHQRDLAADYRLAFGEAPGALNSIAVMSDSDNTRSQSRAWYGAVELR